MPRRTERGVRPGFSLLDWNRLNQHAKDLAQRKGAPLRAISAAEVAEHASEYDAWTILKGKVYNMTPYLHYHPGGVQILLPSAGRDCTQQFDKFHRWINGHSMMAGCELGWLDP
ncbi:cytochrome b5-like heme/steroid binding domain-containing protein [Pelagophyceae sp. CCMP2097]|nr:cytochrome b5-like heme/steroid binding domain-containing protein [Pelagophyceae sp. CCMP2097]